jgi:hypothetical protein
MEPSPSVFKRGGEMPWARPAAYALASACALIIPAGVDGQLGLVAAIRRGISLARRVFGRVLGVYASYLALVIAGRVMLNDLMAGDEGPGPGFFVLLGLWFPGLLVGIAQVNFMFTLLYCEAREMGAAPIAAQAGGRCWRASENAVF